MALEEVARVRPRGEFIDLHRSGNPESGCVKSEAQAATSGKQVQYARREISCRSEACDLCGDGRRHLHRGRRITIRARRRSNAARSRVSHSHTT
jgi:hypothetical protein